EVLRDGDEQHVRQIYGDVDVAVDERDAVLPAEHFLHGLDRIAFDLAESDLVHLLEHHHGIAAADVAQRTDDLAGLRASACAARADPLRLAAAAQLDARERSAESARERCDE